MFGGERSQVRGLQSSVEIQQRGIFPSETLAPTAVLAVQDSISSPQRFDSSGHACERSVSLLCVAATDLVLRCLCHLLPCGEAE